jgi:O-antigen polymerase
MFKNSATNWALFCLSGYFLLGIHLVIPNNGGMQGDSLPWVLTGWMMLCLMMAGVWLRLPHQQTLRITSTFKGIVAGCLLLTLPLLWSPHADWQIYVLPRLAGLWGGVAVCFTLLQCRLTAKHWRLIMMSIAVSAVIQALFVLTEMFFPLRVPAISQNVIKGLGYGVFQQRNVTATYLATGLIVLLMLMTDSRAVQVNHRAERVRLALIAAGTIVLSATLLLLNSRVGWLSSIAGVTLLSLLSGFTRSPLLLRHRVWMVLALPLLGVLLGYGLTLLKPQLVYVAHTGSSEQRWLTIKACLQMLVEKPLSGWGYGGFEYAFQHWVSAQKPPVLSMDMMNHPHNEILFWGVEGGITALLGLGVLAATGVRLITRHATPPRLALSLCLLPILLHTQLEYPLYQSLAHWLIVLLFLVSLDNEHPEQYRQDSPHGMRRFGQFLIVLAALAGVGLSGVALRNEITLTEFELRTLTDDNQINHLVWPWLAENRYQQNLALLDLIRFEKTGNVAVLEDFVLRARRWSQTRIDADMYNNLINVERFLGRYAQAERDRVLAASLFPYDLRFTVTSTL